MGTKNVKKHKLIENKPDNKNIIFIFILHCGNIAIFYQENLVTG